MESFYLDFAGRDSPPPSPSEDFWDKYDFYCDVLSLIMNAATLALFLPYAARVASIASSPVLGAAGIGLALVVKSGVKINGWELLRALVKRIVKAKYEHEVYLGLSFLGLSLTCLGIFVVAPVVSQLFLRSAEVFYGQGNFYRAQKQLEIALALYENSCIFSLGGAIAENGRQDFKEALAQYNKAANSCLDERGVQAKINLLRVKNIQNQDSGEPLERARTAALSERFYLMFVRGKHRVKDANKQKIYKGLLSKGVAWAYLNNSRIEDAKIWIERSIEFGDRKAVCLIIYLPELPEEEKQKSAKDCLEATEDYIAFVEINQWRKDSKKILGNNVNNQNLVFYEDGNNGNNGRHCGSTYDWLVKLCDQPQ